MNRVTVKCDKRTLVMTHDLKPGERGRITNNRSMSATLEKGDIVLKLSPFRGAEHLLVVLRTGVALVDNYPCELVTEPVTIESED